MNFYTENILHKTDAPVVRPSLGLHCSKQTEYSDHLRDASIIYVSNLTLWKLRVTAGKSIEMFHPHPRLPSDLEMFCFAVSVLPHCFHSRQLFAEKSHARPNLKDLFSTFHVTLNTLQCCATHKPEILEQLTVHIMAMQGCENVWNTAISYSVNTDWL